ncbi:MAG: dephospho-CoA kinase [Bacteriovoracaceae bacterium]|nr:dephospho-CoA kinase [Bacteriovoracaceae bacterium]
MKRLKMENRLYELPRPIIGMTGGIGSGKSTVCQLLREQGLHIIDADALVKKIYQDSIIQEWIKKNFPEAWDSGPSKIDFPKLKQHFFSNPSFKGRLESEIYSQMPKYFMEEAKQTPGEQKYFFYDIPLLFEKNLQDKFDLIVLVYASRKTQIERIIRRDNCSLELAEKILSQQGDIDEKKNMSHEIINNETTLEELKINVNHFLTKYKDFYEKQV